MSKYTENMRDYGKMKALDLQLQAPDMSNTELVAQADFIPRFVNARATLNMLQRTAGFVCQSSAGRVVRLVQPYDSDVYTGEPEELPAQWGFVWSTDPDKALPFVAVATSPYMIGDCCTESEQIWRCVVDNTVHAPSAYPDAWEVVTHDAD